MKIFEVSGTDHEMGHEIGKQFKPYLRSVMAEYESLVPRSLDRIRLLESKLAKLLPNCLEELYGRADGAEVDRDAMLLYMFPEVLGKTDGCTTLTVKRRDEVLFAHNEDDVGFGPDNVALVKYNYADGFVFAYTMACRMAGSAFAYNSSGLVFSSNYIFGGALETDNISRYILLRDVINSKSVDEVEEKLSGIDAASPFSLNVVDVKAAKAYNFEKDIRSLQKVEIDGKYARSNHFVLKAADLTRVPANSIFRCEKSRELIAGLDAAECTADDLRAILSYEGDCMDRSVFQNPAKYPDKRVTVSTFVADCKRDSYVVYDYIDRMRYQFDGNAALVSSSRMDD